MLEKITASAGSGKTFTLTRRFLALLKAMCVMEQEHECSCVCRKFKNTNDVRVFSEILAVTFTNKAATEMKSRVIEALKNFALQKNNGKKPGEAEIAQTENHFTPEEAHQWLNTILRRYDGLNIRTIDSLLTLLVRISSAKLGIAPDFEIDFDDSAYMDPLYDGLLDQLASGNTEIMQFMEECAVYLMSSFDIKGFTPNNTMRELILEALAKIQDYQSEASDTLAEEKNTALPFSDKNIVQACLSEAAEQIGQIALTLQALLKQHNLMPLENFAKLLQKSLNYSEFVQSCKDYSEIKKQLNSVYLDKASLCNCLPVKYAAQVTAGMEQAYQIFRTAVNAQKQRVFIYHSALSLLPIAKTATLLLPGLYALRENSGKLPGSMLPNLAKEVLDASVGVSEACCRMGSQLTHLLIDEFQDTSRAQWNAIEPLAVECLSHGGSVRYVGDKKQAIYSWRGGDSSLFDEVSALPELLAICPEPEDIYLHDNWRSSPFIVEHNNLFFSRLNNNELAGCVAEALLSKDTPDQIKNEAAHVITQAFSKVSQSIPEKRKNTAIQGFVSIQKISGLNAPDFQEKVEKKFKELFVNDLMSRRKPEEIAILVRSGTEANSIAAWLGELGLSVVTEHSFKLSASPLVQRLVAFLRFIDYPGDDLNFWNFISGPECFCKITGLEPDKLEAWLSGIRLEQNNSLPQKHLFSFFKRDFAEIWNLLLNPFYNQAGLLSAYDLMNELYSRYSLEILLPEQNIYLRSFLELLHVAEHQGYYSPAAFLDFWDNKGKEAKIPMPETPEAVRILTLHKAKGLEFPVVIMPFHRFPDKASFDLCLFKFEEKLLLLKESEDLGARYYRQKYGSALEKLYLLYVGWTRAKEELHLFVGGSDHDLKRGIPKALEILFADYSFSEDGYYCKGERPAASIVKSEPCAAETNNSQDYQENWHTEDWHPMAWLPRLKIFRNQMPEIVYNEKMRGTFLHSCLENLYLLDANITDDLLQNIINCTVEYTLRSSTLPLNCLNEAKRDALKALNWFCSLPKAKIWLQHGKREQSIMNSSGNLRRMDMLIQERNNFYVLEYKSGKPQKEHREQLNNYLKLLAHSSLLCSHDGVHKTGALTGILVYLDEQRLEEVNYV